MGDNYTYIEHDKEIYRVTNIGDLSSAVVEKYVTGKGYVLSEDVADIYFKGSPISKSEAQRTITKNISE